MTDPPVPQVSTALARRSPDALRRSPEFYPEGHAGPELATVLFGAPLAGAIGSGVLLALVFGAVGGLLGGMFTVPLTIAIANQRLAGRGKAKLAAARTSYRHDTARGLAALETVAQSGALPEVRLEAAAHVALHQIEQGDIRGAIDTLSIREQDATKFRRRRNWEVGLRGELLRSILAWLSPGSFAESGVAASDAFNERDIDEHGRALLALLRVLERAAAPEDGALAQSWRDTRGTELHSLFPTLHIIGLSVASERVHHLLDSLHERLDGDRGEQFRSVLRQLFPRMQLLDTSGYREASPDEPVSMTRALAVAVPKEVVALAKLDDIVEPGSDAPAAFATTYSVVMGLCAAAGLAGGSGLVGAVVGVFMSIYFGTPIAAIWGSRRTQAARRAHRIAPLAALQPAPPTPWLVECASGPPGPVARTSGYQKLLPIPEGTMVVYVAVARAKDALMRREHDEAWQHVAWWYEGFSGRLQHDESMYGAGSALVSIAALTGHLADARRLMSVLPERGNEWDTPQTRTFWGNAPFATRLTDALLLALEGEWDMVKARLEWALQSAAVHLSEHDRALVELIVYKASKAGVSISWPLESHDPSAKTWASAVWPADD
ncbi:MAG: hypothetical protein KUG77_10305 [Nannocystaceae bacterium]|nr:hypothetical protein [Nannocystaceae bacterium]